MEKNQKYVVQCIKGNNNQYGFGYRHKVGHFITRDGKGTFNIYNAYIYQNNNEECCALDNLDESWEKYYKYVPVEVIVKIIENE